MKLEVIADYACKCGEGPMWHPLEKRLYWTDIETGRMFRYDPASGKHEQFYSGPRVGGYTIQPDGSLLLFRDKGNIALWKDGKIVKTIVEAIPGEEQGRFNDVIADPEGRVFCGTLSDVGKPGRLYRLDPANGGGKLTKLLDGIGCSNGLGFTPDLSKMYYTDTLAYSIYLFDYDRRSGAITNQRTFFKSPKEEGYPDGMTVDVHGDVWTTRWDGSMMVRVGPDGKEKQRVTFPTPKISCCIFGGDDLTDMYVTTAGGDDKNKNGPTAGALYRCKPGVKGGPEFFSRVGV